MKGLSLQSAIRFLFAVPLLVSLAGLPVLGGVVCVLASTGGPPRSCCCHPEGSDGPAHALRPDCGCRLAPAPFHLPKTELATTTAGVSASGDSALAAAPAGICVDAHPGRSTLVPADAARSGPTWSQPYLSGGGFRC